MDISWLARNFWHRSMLVYALPMGAAWGLMAYATHTSATGTVILILAGVGLGAIVGAPALADVREAKKAGARPIPAELWDSYDFRRIRNISFVLLQLLTVLGVGIGIAAGLVYFDDRFAVVTCGAVGAAVGLSLLELFNKTVGVDSPKWRERIRDALNEGDDS